MDQIEKLKTGSPTELETKFAEQTHTINYMAEQAGQQIDRIVSMKRNQEEKLRECEGKWKQWAEKEAQLKVGKAVSVERKKRQAKGKALPFERVTVATQTQLEEKKPIEVDLSTQIAEMVQERRGTQRAGTVEELAEAVNRKEKRSERKWRANDSEDTGFRRSWERSISGVRGPIQP